MPYELSLPGGVAEFPDDLPIEKARQAVVDHIAKTYPQEEQVGAISQFLKMAGLGAAPAAAGLAAFGPSAALYSYSSSTGAPPNSTSMRSQFCSGFSPLRVKAWSMSYALRSAP